MSQLSINLPFSPVPITLQTFALLMCILTMGGEAFLPVSLYILEGAMGFPVFAGWSGGIFKLLGPTGGYILGFAAASLIGGYVWDRVKGTFLNAMLVGLLVHVLVYSFGVLQLSLFVGYDRVVELGILPFVLGDALKTVAAAITFKTWDTTA